MWCVQWRWLPDPAGDAGVAHLDSSTLCPRDCPVAKLMRMIRTVSSRSLMLPMYSQESGTGRKTVLRRHILRNALVPVLTLLSLHSGSLLTGALVTEKVFDRPGLGTLLLDAVSARNYAVVQGTVIVMAVLYTFTIPSRIFCMDGSTPNRVEDG